MRWPSRVLFVMCLLIVSPAAAEPAALWRALAGGGHVVLMRHATAPGTGDPPGFRLDDCATQRTLSDAGRQEARRIGDAFRRNGVAVARVLTSRWCRAAETGALLGVAAVEAAPVLDSFFNARHEEAARTAALRALLARLPRDGPITLMVTHQVNITALTGVVPRSGEGVVLRLLADGGALTVGRLPPP